MRSSHLQLAVLQLGCSKGRARGVPFLVPPVKQEDVAVRIATAIARDRRVLVLPPIVRLIPVLRLLPPTVIDRLMDLSGVNVSMHHFVGRRSSAPTTLPA